MAGVEALVVRVSVVVPVWPGDSVRFIVNDVFTPVAGGVTGAARVIRPLRPLLVRVMVDVVEPPASKLGGVAGDAEIVKLAVTTRETTGNFDTCVELIIAVAFTLML